MTGVDERRDTSYDWADVAIDVGLVAGSVLFGFLVGYARGRLDEYTTVAEHFANAG